MKNIILTLFFLFSIFTMNNITISNAERSIGNYNISNYDALLEKVKKMEREMFMKDLIQHVELESEIIIPNYIDIKYIEYTYNLANQLRISIRSTFRLMYKESGFNDTVKSSGGAYGLMQLMPGTRNDYYELLRVDTLTLDKNQQDIYIGLNYLKDSHDYWKQRGNSEEYSWTLALASYNAGKGKVKKYQGIPPYKQTQDFVKFISKAHSNPEFYINYMKKYENTPKMRT